MANNSNTGQNHAGENVVFSPTFLLPAAFPGMTGINLDRHQITNLVNAGFPTVSIHQPMQQQQQQQVMQAGVKSEMHQTSNAKQVKQHHRNNQHHVTQQQQAAAQQQLLQQQQLTPQLMAVAFPGQHVQASGQQQHLQTQGHQQHTAIITTVQGGAGTSASHAWTCPACKLSFKSASELQSHLSVHSSQPAANYTTQNGIMVTTSNSGNNSTHTKTEKSVPCQTCGKLFASAERVRIHVRVAHGEKSCACDICGSGFSYRCKLMDHMRTHTGDKPFRCEQCGRSFSQKNHLRRHQMIHTGERPFPCEVCGRGFYRKDKLNRHRRIHMNNVGGAASNNTVANRGGNAKQNTASNANNTVTIPANASQGQIVSAITGGGTTVQLVPLFQQAAATHQWVVNQQRLTANNASNNVSQSNSNNNNANNGSTSSNPSTPTTSS